ncbi:MAG: hypothetical protein ABS97_01805 [Lysobacteraceae bacterium SCN 69-320]|nr:MAG: hypothetical protein ABS97_01805 [Xanthomonadaceae bacterium SCN 69-320]
MAMTATLQTLEDRLRPYGASDFDYLRHHYARYRMTKREFESDWPRVASDSHVLDIGAHWLHQCALYALDGYRVTALDLPATLECASTAAFARDHGIELIVCRDLERPASALAALADDSVDVVLFTEILEHITFNPVALWREIHRVLKPGGRIVVTTPNYYALRGRSWAPQRLLQRFGAGPSTWEILYKPTYANHWKEYSLREVIHYFCLLSGDFITRKALHQPEYADGYLQRRAGRLLRWLERRIPLLRPDLYVEIELSHKQAGINIEPAW